MDQWRRELDAYLQQRQYEPLMSAASDDAYRRYYEVVSDTARDPGMTDAEYAQKLADNKDKAQAYAYSVNNAVIAGDPDKWQAALNHDTDNALTAYAEVMAAGAAPAFLLEGAAAFAPGLAERLGARLMLGAGAGLIGDTASQFVGMGAYGLTDGYSGQASFSWSEFGVSGALGLGGAVAGEVAGYLLGKLGGSVDSVPDTTGPSFLTPEEFAQLPSKGRINPSTIRFSQDSASANFRPPYGSVDDFTNGLVDGSIDPASVAPIRIVEKDGMIYTLDNRRLYGFQQAYEQAGFDSHIRSSIVSRASNSSNSQRRTTVRRFLSVEVVSDGWWGRFV